MPVTCRLCSRTFAGRGDGQVSAIDELADHHTDEHADVLEPIVAPKEVSADAGETKV